MRCAQESTRMTDRGDVDLIPVGVLLWIGSVAVVALALWHHDVFDAQTTLALAAVASLSWFFVRAGWRSYGPRSQRTRRGARAAATDSRLRR